MEKKGVSFRSKDAKIVWYSRKTLSTGMNLIKRHEMDHDFYRSSSAINSRLNDLKVTLDGVDLTRKSIKPIQEQYLDPYSWLD